MKYYTGIGSRSTPSVVLEKMTELASFLEERGMTLRSGAAGGADSAFEEGVVDSANKNIFIPWRSFNGRGGDEGVHVGVCEGAMEMASQIHPAWYRCSPGAKLLHARNIYQVLGLDLKTPSEVLFCWTPKGEMVGGTATAIRLALAHDVEVVNLGHPVGWAEIDKVMAVGS